MIGASVILLSQTHKQKPMKSLQSKDMPLRTQQQFYEPFYKQKSGEGIRVFPEKHHDSKEAVLVPIGDLPSVYTYLSGINEAKHLPRRIANKYEYYPLVKSCKRHQFRSALKDGLKAQNPEESHDGSRNRIETLVSNFPSNRSLVAASQANLQQRRIAAEKAEFRQTRSLRKQEKEKEMRFSFYNTIEKSQHFLRKFKEDSFIQQRKTNNFQNMFKRTITSENILSILQRAREKYKLGSA